MRREHFLFQWSMGQECCLSRSIPEPFGVCFTFHSRYLLYDVSFPDQSSKFPKLTESIDNDISMNLNSQCIPSLADSPDLLFNGFITGPVDMTRDLLLGSIKT